MRSEWQDIRLLHDILKHRDRWYVEIKDISHTADVRVICYATQRLRKMCCLALYWRYKRWLKSNPIITRDYYYSFLDDVLFDLVRSTLRGINRDKFEDNALLKIRFV